MFLSDHFLLFSVTNPNIFPDINSLLFSLPPNATLLFPQFLSSQFSADLLQSGYSIHCSVGYIYSSSAVTHWQDSRLYHLYISPEYLPVLVPKLVPGVDWIYSSVATT